MTLARYSIAAFSQLPDNFAIGRDECLRRCGLTRGTQPTTQRQPRVSANALPPNTSSATYVASAASSTPTPHKREDAWAPVQLRKRD